MTADQARRRPAGRPRHLADGLWHAPAETIAPDRYRLVADALGDRSVSRSELIEVLVEAGYTRSSAGGRTISTHPLIAHVGPARYRLTEHTKGSTKTFGESEPTEPSQRALTR